MDHNIPWMKIESVQNNGTNNCYGAKIFKVKYHSLSILNVETPLIDLIKNYLTGNFYFL